MILKRLAFSRVFYVTFGALVSCSNGTASDTVPGTIGSGGITAGSRGAVVTAGGGGKDTRGAAGGSVSVTDGRGGGAGSGDNTITGITGNEGTSDAALDGNSAGDSTVEAGVLDSSGAGDSASNGYSDSGDASGSADSGDATGCMGPVGTISGDLATGVIFLDTDGERVNAHGGGIIKEGDTFYMHGEFFLSTTTDNNFNGFSMYSSKDLATWKNEGIILPQQTSGELGPNRKGERPHIIKCPDTGEFVLYAHAASSDYQTDKEVVFATSSTVNGQYQYRGPLKNASGRIAAHSDMTAFTDGSFAYVLTESGHVYTLAADCHSWLSDETFSVINGDSGGAESPTVFKAGDTYYWIGSYKTGWRANNNFYSTAPAITGPWTYQGYIAPVTDTSNKLSDERTWLSQSTWVQPVVGCKGIVYIYWGDHWDGNLDTTAPGKHNALATYVFQPLVFDGIKISIPTYQDSWNLDVGAGTWSPTAP